VDTKDRDDAATGGREAVTAALDDLYLDVVWQGPADRPAVAVGMVASADGAAVVDGVSGGLGGAADLQAFRRLREAADVVLVASGTVRAEDYGPATVGPQAEQRRLAAGRASQPELAILTASGRLDPQARVFSDPQRRPLLITPAATPADRLAALVPARADHLVAGDQRVDLLEALRALGRRGHALVLVEGGPSLNGQLFAAGLVDELFLTVAPLIAGQTTRRIVEGELATPVGLTLLQVTQLDDEVLLRYAQRGREAPVATVHAESRPKGGM